jgi:hypothetical protein
MRIISKFKDYYDGVQRTAMDPSIVYYRKQYFSKESHGFFRQDSIWSDDTRIIKIGFCGKLYFIGKGHLDKNWIFGEELAEKVKSPFDKYFPDGGVSGKILTEHGKEDHTLFLKYRCPVFIYDIERNPKIFYNNNPIRGVVVGGRLESYHFFKIFDAFTAYQMISQFIANDLAKQEDPAPLSDKDRARAHGFDKWSFRKDTPPKRKLKK